MAPEGKAALADIFLNGLNDRIDKAEADCKHYRERIDQLERRNAELREACEAALRIKSLWLPPPPAKCLPEHEGEAVALVAMYESLTAALAGEGERE